MKGKASPGKTWSSLRWGVPVFAGLDALFWLYLVVGGLNDALPFPQGFGGVAAVLGTMVFVPFALPALGLALADRALKLAAVLAVIAGFLYSLDALYRRSNVLDAVPVSGVLGVGFIVAVAGFALVASRRRRAAGGG